MRGARDGDVPERRAVLALRPRLLALRALGLGDLLTALPALRALADAFPAHHRVLATPAPLAPLALLAGAADEVVPAAGLGRLPPGPAAPDVAVDLHGRGPESHRLLAALRPRRLIAFGCPAAGVPGPLWLPGEHEVARWCRLLAESGIPADPARLDLAVEPEPAAAGATIVHPGAASAARRWPAERFAAVARHEVTAGRRVLVTGGPAEAPLAAAVARRARLGPEAVLAGRTDVVGLARIVAAAARVVCPDTGVAHLATALGTPSVVLFGPMSPGEWGPPPGPLHRALWAGRTGDPHGRTLDPGLGDICVGDVVAALRELPPRAAVRVGAPRGSRLGRRDTGRAPTVRRRPPPSR